MNDNTASSSDLSRGPFSATKLVSVVQDHCDLHIPSVAVYIFFSHISLILNLKKAL